MERGFRSAKARSPRPGTAGDSLHEIFQVPCDDFWSWHWTFKSTRLPKPQPLLGEARVTDLAVNVILPWLWIRAREGGNEKLASARWNADFLRGRPRRTIPF